MSVEKWLVGLKERIDEDGWITDPELLEQMDEWVESSKLKIEIGGPVEAREFQRQYARVFKRSAPDSLVELYSTFSSLEIRSEQNGDLQYEGNIISGFDRQLFQHKDDMGYMVEGFAEECAELYGRNYFPLWFRDSPTAGAAGACLDVDSGKVVAIFPAFEVGDPPTIDEIAESVVGWLELCDEAGLFAPGAIGAF